MANQAVENQLAVLRIARKILETSWAKCDDALDTNGNEVSHYSSTAVKFPLFGAIQLAEYRFWGDWNRYSDAYEYVIGYFKREMGQPGTFSFNNHSQITLEDVLSVVDNCIQELEIVQ